MSLTASVLLLEQDLLDTPVSSNPRGPDLRRCNIESPTVFANVAFCDGVPRSLNTFYRSADPELRCIYIYAHDAITEHIPDGKVASITKVFQDSYKSPLSVIVVDNIERLLGWCTCFCM